MLSVRPFERSDIPLVVDYWATLSPTDLDRMGIDPTRIRLTDLRQQLEERFDLPVEVSKNFKLVWELDGQCIGLANLRNIAVGEIAGMHLHIWSPSFRGKGYGATLFCLSVVEFYERFRPARIVCEPRAENEMPNRMLKKIGFPLQKTFQGKGSEIQIVCQINSYDIRRDIAEAYLKR